MPRGNGSQTLERARTVGVDVLEETQVSVLKCGRPARRGVQLRSQDAVSEATARVIDRRTGKNEGPGSPSRKKKMDDRIRDQNGTK